MTTQKITELKRIGAERMLLAHASSRLFIARKHIENADKEGFKQFEKEIGKAREAIAEAEQLWSASRKTEG